MILIHVTWHCCVVRSNLIVSLPVRATTTSTQFRALWRMYLEVISWRMFARRINGYYAMMQRSASSLLWDLLSDCFGETTPAAACAACAPGAMCLGCMILHTRWLLAFYNLCLTNFAAGRQKWPTKTIAACWRRFLWRIGLVALPPSHPWALWWEPSCLDNCGSWRRSLKL